MGLYRGTCYLDGTSRGSCGTGNATYLSLFSQNYNNSEWSILTKFYELKVYNNDSTVYHHVFPCQRKSDGVIGVYDTVYQKFYTNIGSGTFTAGPVVDEY